MLMCFLGKTRAETRNAPFLSRQLLHIKWRHQRRIRESWLKFAHTEHTSECAARCFSYRHVEAQFKQLTLPSKCALKEEQWHALSVHGPFSMTLAMLIDLSCGGGLDWTSKGKADDILHILMPNVLRSGKHDQRPIKDSRSGQRRFVLGRFPATNTATVILWKKIAWRKEDTILNSTRSFRLPASVLQFSP